MDQRKESKNKLSLKQLVCMALVAMMLLGVVPLAAFAEDNVPQEPAVIEDEGVMLTAEGADIAPYAALDGVTVQVGSSVGIMLGQNANNSTRFTVTATDSDGKAASGFSVRVLGRNLTRNATLSVGGNVTPGTYNVTIQYGTNTDTIAVVVTPVLNKGNMPHLELEVHVQVNAVVNGTAVPLTFILEKDDVNANTTKITATHNGVSTTFTQGAAAGQTIAGVTPSWTSTGTDYSTEDDTVKMNGTFPTGTIDNPVMYTIEVKKTITTTIDGVAYNIPVTLSVTTHYWDAGNHCPGLTNKTSWKNGNYLTSSGIDFAVGATGSYTSQGDIQINKYLVGLDGTAPTDMTFAFDVYKLNANNGYDKVKTVKLELEAGKDYDNTILSSTLAKLDVGTYYIVESSASVIDGMNFNGITYSGTGVTTETITIGSVQYTAAKVALTDKAQIYVQANNNYEVATGNLTVKKVFSGLPTGAQTPEITVTVTGSNGAAQNVVLNADNNYEYTLTDLPVGNYTVAETEASKVNVGSYKWTGVAYSSASVAVSNNGNAVATVTNSYEAMVGNLTVEKLVEIDGEATGYEDIEYNFSVAAGADVDAAALREWIAAGNSLNFTLKVGEFMELVGLPVGTYNVNENASAMAEVGYYAWDHVEYSKTSAVVTEGATEKITATNVYVKKYTDITVSKLVTGNMSDVNKKFNFTATGFEPFALSDGESITLEKVEIGAPITITEESGVYIATYKVNGGEATATTVENFRSSATVEVADGMEVEFTNDYDITIDTGIELDTLPFVILLAIAGSVLVLLNRKRLF